MWESNNYFLSECSFYTTLNNIVEVTPKTLRIYQRPSGELPFVAWIRKLRDMKAKQAIEARLDRVRLGNLGDHRSVGEGVMELKFHVGPGYRVYIGQDGDTVVVLLCGGDKSTQDEDIQKAKRYWKEYKGEKKNAND